MAAPLIPGAERRHVEVKASDAGRLRVHVSELGSGPPVLMLHGWPQHAGCWRHVAPRVAERYRVICPDLRGFGESDAPGRGYDPQTFAADAAALLDALGLERAFLVGHDWGGFAGFLLCFARPERIAAFLALNTPLPWTRPTPRLLAETWRSWYAVLMASPIGPRIVQRRPDLIARGMRSDAVQPGMTEEEARGFADSLARPASARATALLYRSYLRALAEPVRGSRRGKRLEVPTRVLFGTQDAAVSVATVQGQEGDADDFAVELVDDSGHFIADEKPELVAQRALELFGSVRAPG